MDADANRELVLGYYRDVAAGDFAAARARLSDDSTLWILGEGHWPLGGMQDMASLQRIWQIAQDRFPDGIRMEVTGMTVEGERVAVEAKAEARRVDGRIYANNYHILFVVRGGKIVARREYMNVLHANDLLCGPLQAADAADDRGA